MPTFIHFVEPPINFFSLLIVDPDGNPLDSFDTTEPVNVAIIHIEDGPEAFSRTVFSALHYGLSMTVAEIDFGWGVVVCHLPQVDDDDPGGDVQRVMFSAENEFFRIIFGDDATGPTGSTGPDDSGLLGWQSLDNSDMG